VRLGSAIEKLIADNERIAVEAGEQFREPGQHGAGFEVVKGSF
jgi:hypothetical protein